MVRSGWRPSLLARTHADADAAALSWGARAVTAPAFLEEIKQETGDKRRVPLVMRIGIRRRLGKLMSGAGRGLMEARSRELFQRDLAAATYVLH